MGCGTHSAKSTPILFCLDGGASGGHLAIILDEGEERLVIEVQNHTLTYDVSYPFYEDIIKKTWHGN